MFVTLSGIVMPVRPEHWETAADVTRRMLAYAQKHPLPFGMFYNVNVPDLDPFEINGWRVTDLGVVRYKKDYVRCTDPLGKPYYWAPRERLKSDPDADTDVAWIKKGFITVTPMGYDSARLDAADLSDVFGGQA